MSVEFPLPQLGDVVLCHKDFQDGSDAIHPAVITGVDQQLGRVMVEVALSSSRISRMYPGDIEVSEANPEEFAASGLKRASRFKTNTIHKMEWNADNFAVPANRRFGNSPKIGVLLPSALLRLVRAFHSIR